MLASWHFWALGLLAAAAGASFVMQAAVNTQLRGALGSACWASFVSYLGGTLVMLAVLAVMREPVPTASAMAKSSWLHWTGGLFGAVYVVITILLLPRLGAAAMLALFVAGQMAASLAFDHFGLFGLARQPADPLRLLGALLLVAGVVLVRR
ncbi:MAG: DMT family transporter [Desulfarculaceae bacterium]|nr:DMT family transporter [Desulfarculaceae bacterium]MCF8074319.1 DMT family transporter [Desulfarculaceae bacterium]MCF8103387.1 DMT family transporter [Desulfarculaceae bacterium]MCF8117758.1 DMT family transporter [Desulfarculaceae bacterium]